MLDLTTIDRASRDRLRHFQRTRHDPRAVALLKRVGYEPPADENVFEGFGRTLHRLILHGLDTHVGLSLIFGRDYEVAIGKDRLLFHRALVAIKGRDWTFTPLAQYCPPAEHRPLLRLVRAHESPMEDLLEKLEACNIDAPKRLPSVPYVNRRYLPPTEDITTGPSPPFDTQATDMFSGMKRWILSDTWGTLYPTALAFAGFSCSNPNNQNAQGSWSALTGPNSESKGRPEAGPQTANRAALQAVLEVLSLCPWRSLMFRRLIIAINSEYVVLGISERAELWEARAWKTRRGHPVANVDLWEKILKMVWFWEDLGVEILMWNVQGQTNARASNLARNVK